MKKLAVTVLLLWSSVAMGAAAAPQADKRLDQKITYSGYKRVHDVMDDLKRLSGVGLYSGASLKEWQVRDIPVTLYVKDMPLGDVLTAVADATHQRITSTTIKDVRTYRVWKNTRLLDALAKHDETIKKNMEASAAWGWDALVACSKLPSSQLEGLRSYCFDPERAQAVGKILSGLGPEGRNKLLAGDTIAFTVGSADPAIKSAVETLYRRAWAERFKPQNGAPPMVMKDADMAKGIIEIADPESRQCYIRVSELRAENTSSQWSDLLHNIAFPMATKEGLGLPKYPAELVWSEPKDMGFANTDLHELREDKDWKLPLLEKKVTIRTRKTEEQFSYCDVIMQVAEQSGINIVCEDFASHMDPIFDGRETGTAYSNSGIFDKEVTVANVLRQYVCMKWHVDEKRNLMVAHNSDWKRQHENLVPEAMVQKFREKIDGNGAGIEDLLPVMILDRGQINDWFKQGKNMPELGADYISSIDLPLWRLYDYLNADDKAQARSSAGFALSACDPQWLNDALKKRQYDMENGRKAYYLQYPDYKKRDEIPSDASVIPTLVMRLKSQPSSFTTTVTIENGTRQVSRFSDGTTYPDKPCYFLEVAGANDGEKFATKIAGPEIAFPIYSPTREAEIQKAKSKSK